MGRTYVRRRLVALTMALAVVAGVGGRVAAALSAPGGGTGIVASRTYVVRPGDTLWSIASAIAPERDPREVVIELQRHNRADASSLAPGQVLAIPPLD